MSNHSRCFSALRTQIKIILFVEHVQIQMMTSPYTRESAHLLSSRSGSNEDETWLIGAVEVTHVSAKEAGSPVSIGLFVSRSIQELLSGSSVEGGAVNTHIYFTSFSLLFFVLSLMISTAVHMAPDHVTWMYLSSRVNERVGPVKL